MQLRVLRERRGFHTQVAFAKHAGMQQPAISRVENADYQSWTFQTLLKVANKLDARLRVTFEPVEDVIRRLESVDGVEFDSSASREMTGAPATMSVTVVKETLIEEIEESEDSQFDHFIVQTQDDQWPTQSFSTS
jgi:transcriptional regulator with XRE-family HTH domain